MLINWLGLKGLNPLKGVLPIFSKFRYNYDIIYRCPGSKLKDQHLSNLKKLQSVLNSVVIDIRNL